MRGGLSGYLAHAVVAPVRRLSQAAARSARGDLTARVPGGGNGEVAAPMGALSAMAGSLEERQLELDRFFTLSLELLCIADLEGYFRRINPAFEKTLGYSVDELTSIPFLAFVHPDDREATLGEVENLSRGDDVVAFENRYRCKDGSYKWILWNATAVPEEGLIYAAASDVTERRRAEERFRGLVEAAPVAWVVVGEDGRIVLVNAGALNLFGYTREEFVGEQIEALVPEASRGVHPSHRNGFFLAPQARTMGEGSVLYARRKDGSQFPAEIALSPFETEEGVFVIAAVVDLTERKRAEERINALNNQLEDRNVELERQNTELEQQALELEAQQAELEHALADLADAKERVEAFYAFGEKLNSETELQALAQTILRELADFAEAEVGTFYAVADEVGSGDEPAPLHLVATRGIEAGSLPTQLAAGEGLPGRAVTERRLIQAADVEAGLRLVAFGEEVAVQHELDAPLCHGDRALGVVTLARVADRPFSAAEVEAIEHLADQAALALSNALAFADAARQAAITRTVLDATPSGIQLVDLEGHTVLANAPMAEILAGIPGLPREGTVAERIPAVAEFMSDPAGYRAAMESVVGDPEREALFELELAESRRSFQLYTTPVRDSAGAPAGRVFAMRDVTGEREADRLKSELVATVSHELRTPLAAILGFAELLLGRDRDPATRERYLRTIHGEAKRLSALINDFLDLQRIEAGDFKLATEAFELGAVLSKKVELFSGQSATHTLELALPAEPLVLHGERDRIAQVVANLLSNAIKYSPAGGRVQVRAEPGESTVRVSVSDEGLGIPADQQEQIFSKFFRVDSSDTREIGGTGLGLALCREIVEAHGGHVGFESVEGRGSTFWFELTLAPERNGSGPQRVLVIEDDPAAAALLSEYLWEDGYTAEVQATGEAAVERARVDPPLLVCLDIGLAGELDGWQVLAELKESPSTAHIPVVVCTAGNGHDQAAALGAADFLAKPFSDRRLHEVVSRLLPVQHGSVLIVDDEESIRQLVRETVGGNGVEVREAADGEQALAAVAERRPDAIVLDLVMPKLDGLGVLEHLQKDAATRSIPVVVLTGRRLSRKQRNALQKRAVSLLAKNGCSRGELRRLISRALGQELLDQVE